MAQNDIITFQERIARIMNDEKFRRFCEIERLKTSFDESFSMAEKIAKIDISDIQFNDRLIMGQFFTPEETERDVFAFYQTVDQLAPDEISLTQILQDNNKYLVSKTSNDSTRSYCKSAILPDGTPLREIYINLEGRIGDTETAIHESCHSMCADFLKLQYNKDPRNSEIPTVLADKLSSMFLKSVHPELALHYIENNKFRQILNVKKARECLADGLIIKVMTGEQKLEDIMSTYGELFKQFPDILPQCLDRIENFDFQPMYEKRYLIPQAIALEVVERNKDKPKVLAKQFKEIITHNHEWTQEDILEYLELPNADKLIDNYVAKFPKRMQEIEAETKLHES